MRQSAGLLMYRRGLAGLEVFLVHPGGPFFARRDVGVWGVPKGLFEEGEEPLATARREFEEETGRSVAECAVEGGFARLGSVVQRGGKTVHAWAFEGDWPEGLEPRSNTFELEWPRGSGRVRRIPEIDRAEFFPIEAARAKINPAQEPFLDRLVERIEGS